MPLKTNNPCLFFIILILSGLVTGCILPTQIEKENKLLVGNKIHLAKPIETTSELNNFIQQKPNSKMLGVFRFKLWVYRYSSSGKQGLIKSWLNRAVAEKPVFLDTLLAEMAGRKMKLYLNNVGYFNSTVKKTFTCKKHKTTANFHIVPGEAYRLRSYTYNIKDSVLRKIVLENAIDSKVKPGQAYNSYMLDSERDRIVLILKNNGYYAFTKDYLHFTVDSAFSKNAMDLVLTLNNPLVPDPAKPGQNIEKQHRLFHVRRVFVVPDFDPLNQNSKLYDTITYIRRYESLPEDTVIFLCREKLKVKPAVLARSMGIKTGDLYSQESATKAHDRLGDLQFFRLINVSFKKTGDTMAAKANPGLLDCVVQLSRNKYSSTSIGGELTNTGGDFGVSMVTGYEHRNIFGGAELLTLSLNGSMEIRRNYLNDSAVNNGIFNTYEGGFRAGILFPKFMLPLRQERLAAYFRPKTRINGGFNFEITPDYKRFVTDAAFGYEWKQNKKIRHILNPIELSVISIFNTPDFQHYLDSIKDPWYSEQYTDHFIAGMSYSFIFSNQDISRKVNFIYFRGNFQAAGNILSLINTTIPAQRNSEKQNLFMGIPYAQFVKINGDFRDYKLFGKSSLVLRAMAGIGIAYGNSGALPFDRGYYAGGANGLRGWVYGSLGPGGFSNETYIQRYDHMGDVQLEVNGEYRFPIVGMFKGAVFSDAGNVWLLKSNDQFPEGTFSRNFMSQVAMDAGLGFRLDFSFFVFRLDGALKLRNPANPLDKVWINFQDIQLKDVMWNFGIGYPF
ncbi:MAG: BamA/TamA family outer membrane protein [Bacteroidota bacterium]